MGLVPTRGFVPSSIDHLENTGSLSYVNFFHMLINVFKPYENSPFVNVSTD